MKLLGKVSRFLAKNYLLLSIIFLASLLRFIGTNPGYPPIHTDEGITHSQGIAMILEHSLNPQHGYGLPYNYPILVPLINALFYLLVFIPFYTLAFLLLHLGDLGGILQAASSGHFLGIFETNILGPSRINVVFWGRYVTALFGVGVVVMSYLVGKRLFQSAAVGLLAAFFTAVNYRQVLNSHFGLPDIYNAFFLLVAFDQILRLWEKQTTRRYILAGLSVAAFFSTKFQFFAFPPLALILIFLTCGKKGVREKAMFLFQKNIFLMIGAIICAVVVLNIFHIIHFQETLKQVGDSALKYRYGKSSLDFYPISYLYHIGIGSVISVVAVSGIILGLFFRFRQMLLILSAIIPFMWMFVYFTGGGFYTRNFVTVTPLILICAAFGIYILMIKIRDVSKVLSFVLGGLLVIVISYESLSNSLVIPVEYSKPWNYKLTQNWIGKNIPEGETILIFPGTPVPSKNYKIVETKNPNDFSLAKMREDNIRWAVLNIEAVSDNFLWWMNQDTEISLKYWNKPTEILSDTSLARSMMELKSYIVFEALNPWQAPDNNYLIIYSKNPSNFNSKFNLNEHLFLNSNGGM